MNGKGTLIGEATLSGVLTAIPTIEGSLSEASSTSLEGSLSTYPKTIPDYVGDYEITPKAHDDQTLETEGKIMTGNVVVFKVTKHETSNLSGGYTVYIAEE